MQLQKKEKEIKECIVIKIKVGFKIKDLRKKKKKAHILL